MYAPVCILDHPFWSYQMLKYLSLLSFFEGKLRLFTSIVRTQPLSVRHSHYLNEFSFFFFFPTFLEKNQDLLLGSKLIVSHWKKYCAPAWDNSKESKQAKHLDTHINARLYKPTTWSHLSTAFGFDHAASKAVQKKKKIAVFEKKKKKQK